MASKRDVGFEAELTGGILVICILRVGIFAIFGMLTMKVSHGKATVGCL